MNDVRNAAETAAKAIWDDMSDRRGFGLKSLEYDDKDIWDALIKTHADIIERRIIHALESARSVRGIKELEGLGAKDIQEFEDDDGMQCVTYVDSKGVKRGLRSRGGDVTRAMLISKLILGEKVREANSETNGILPMRVEVDAADVEAAVDRAATAVCTMLDIIETQSSKHGHGFYVELENELVGPVVPTRLEADQSLLAIRSKLVGPMKAAARMDTPGVATTEEP